MRETDIYNKLVDKSIHEMLNYPPKDYKKILKDCIKKLIGKTIYPTVKDPIAWPNALCALGLIERLKQDGLRGIGGVAEQGARNIGGVAEQGNRNIEGAIETDNAIFLALQQYFDRWIKDGAKIVKLESLLSGYVLLEYVEILESLIQKRGKSYCISAVRLATSEAELDEKMRSYETIIERFHQYLLTAKKDSNGIYIYNQSREEKIVMADMLGMVCPFLAKYALRYSSEEAAKECLKQLNGFLERAVDKNTSLPWHGYEEKEDTLTPVGILGWGRAVGWILLGIALSVESLGNESMDEADSELLHSIISYAYDLIFKTYEIHKVCDEATEKDIHENAINSTLLRWQFADSENMVVDDLHVDTSATAMFVYSVYKLLSVDISTAKEIHELKLYLETLVNGLENNIKSDGSVINGLAECMGPGIHPQKYGSYPWTVGTTLSALCAQSVYCEK